MSVAKFIYSFYNGGLLNHFDNHFTEIASVHKHQTRLASLQKYYLTRMKTFLGQVALNILIPKFGLIFLKIWNLFRLIYLENNIKTSCFLARIPFDLRFMCLPLSVVLYWCPSFPSSHCLYSCSPHPLYIAMIFPHCFLLLFFMVISPDVDLMHFFLLFYNLWNVFN